MNILKRISPVLLLIAFISAGLYLAGCSSAQSTTGKLAFKEKDYVKAEAELTKGLQIDKNDAEGWYMLGVSQIELGKYAAAEQSFKTSLSINKNYAPEIQAYWVEKFNQGVTNYNTGIELVKKNDSTGYVRAFRTSLNNLLAANVITPDSVKVTQLIGDAYFYMGNKDSALYYYESAISKSKSPDDANQIARIIYDSGVQQLNGDQHEAAISTFGKVMAIPYLPKDNKYYELSALYSGVANYRMAEKVSKENGDFKPYLQKTIDALEPVAASSKNKDILTDAYKFLAESYAGLDMKDKEAAARQKLTELGQ
jgi:tetratricopeptide (TPR) repeat protein